LNLHPPVYDQAGWPVEAVVVVVAVPVLVFAELVLSSVALSSVALSSVPFSHADAVDVVVVARTPNLLVVLVVEVRPANK